jgi:hypothetical protein
MYDPISGFESITANVEANHLLVITGYDHSGVTYTWIRPSSAFYDPEDIKTVVNKWKPFMDRDSKEEMVNQAITQLAEEKQDKGYISLEFVEQLFKVTKLMNE